MMKKGKQAQRKSFLAVLLCFCMMVTMLPAGSVKAEEAESGSANAAVTYETLEGTDGFAGDENVLFDGDLESYGELWFDGEAYVIWKASETLKVTGYSITVKKDDYWNNAPKSWTLYGARERLAKNVYGWTSLDRVEDDTCLSAEDKTTQDYALTNPTSEKYMYFMLKIDQVQDQDILRLVEFTLKYETCDHVWESTNRTTAPDCTKPGANIWCCSKCGAEKEVEDPSDPALGHRMVAGRCNRCGAIEKKKPQGEGTEESPYQIGEVSELYWFAGLVNGDKDVCTDGVTRNRGACAALTADMTINKRVLDADGNLVSCTEGLMEWIPIGKAYWDGTFDGQGHCIRGLYCNDSQLTNAGLFGWIEEGTVTRVGVEDAYIAGKCVGGICGYCRRGTIKNCYVIGTMTGVDSAGGLAGRDSDGTYATSYSIARNAGSGEDLCAVAGDEDEEWMNCYYAPDDNGDLGAQYQSAEEFASGKVAYLLQQSCAESAEEQDAGNVWGQELNADKYPVFDLERSRKVYQTTGCITYSNNPEDQGREKEHGTWKDGICQVCGEMKKKSVSYLDENGAEQSAENVEMMTDRDLQWKSTEEASSWYVVRGDHSIGKRITVSGDVHLILADGCSLQAEKGIQVAEGNCLTIHAQSEGESAGKLIAAGQENNAGIGGGLYGAGGTITICGGNVNASSTYGAGIGGGYSGAGGTITIHGGNVNASSGRDGAGIGGGSLEAGGTITIRGGNVNASGDLGAGIGGGHSGAGGTITIQDGNVDASSICGAGIGGGQYKKQEGSFQTQKEGETGSSGKAVIFASSISDMSGKTSTKNPWSGLIVCDEDGGFYGSLHEAEITGTVSLPDCAELTLKSDEKLTIQSSGMILNYGTMTVNDAGSLINQGTIINYRILMIESGGNFDNASGILQNKGTVINQNTEEEGTISGTVKKALTIKEITTETKEYDGTNRVKVTGITLDGMDEGDEVAVAEEGIALSAIVYYPYPSEHKTVKALEGSVNLAGKDADKYWVDLTCENISCNNGKGVTITKKTEEVVRTVAVRNYLGNRSYSETIGFKDLLGNCGYNFEQKSVKLLDENGNEMQETEQCTVEVNDNGTLRYTINACREGKRKLIVAVESSYYSNIQLVIDMTMVSCYKVQVKEGSKVTADPEGIVYGQSLSELAFQDTVFTDESGNTVPGTLAWKEASVVPKVSETTAEWVFTPQNDAFASLEGDASITVHKQKAQVAENPKVEITYGQKLSDAVLTDGSAVNKKGETLPGHFEWVEPDQIPTAVESGKTKYKAVFVPEEAENYSECETEIAVTVNKAAQAPDMPETEMTVPPTTKTVEEVKLPDNWKWQTDRIDQSSSLEVNVPSAVVAEYVGQDKGNYETERVTVTITRKCTHESTELRKAKPAGCTQDGYSGDYYCTICEAEVKSGKTLEAYGHSYDTSQYTWGIGADGKVNCTAVKTCTREGCNEEETEHRVTETVTAKVQVTKAATCTEKGTRTYTASFTKEGFSEAKTREESIAATGHELTEVETKEATAAEPGNKAYFTCAHCGKYYEDREGKTEITDKDSVVIPAKGMTPTPEPQPTVPSETGVPATNVPQPTLPSETGVPATNVPQPTVPSETGVPATNVPQPTVPSEPGAPATNVPQPTIPSEPGAPAPTVSSTEAPAATAPKSDKQGVSSAPKNTVAPKNAIPDTVTINGVQKVVTSIKKNAYKNNKKLTEVKIGRKVTSIGNNAFAGCKNLKLVELDENITKIGKNVFKNCKKLKTITIRSTKLTKKSLDKDAFKGVSGNTVIKVPEKKRSEYEKLFRKKGLSKKVQIKGYR